MYKNELWENDNYSHNPEVVGSNPASATRISKRLMPLAQSQWHQPFPGFFSSKFH